MRKGILAYLLTFILLVFPLLDVAGVDAMAEPSAIGTYIFAFPAMLQAIEEEAFEGTAVKKIIFRDNLRDIGCDAFKNAGNLTSVYIPTSTECIAECAFTGAAVYTIHGVKGSYAQKWASEHNVCFVIDDIWNCSTESRIVFSQSHTYVECSYTMIPIKEIVPRGGREDKSWSRRPQDRPELNPIDYRFP